MYMYDRTHLASSPRLLSGTYQAQLPISAVLFISSAFTRAAMCATVW
jgi:hypothetical protein